MTSRERVLSSLRRHGYDRIPVKTEAVPEINRIIMDHFGLTNREQLLRMLGDDFRYVAAMYRGPEMRRFEDGTFEGYWGERYAWQEYEGGRYLEAMHRPFVDVDRVEDLDRSRFPKVEYFDFSAIRQQCRQYEGRFAICYGTAGDMDFINQISKLLGMERVLMGLATKDPVLVEIMEERSAFYYAMHESALQAAEGMIDIIHVGDDLGTQRGPMISMDIFDRLFAPKYEKLFAMAHRYGAKTMMHMCGCVEPFLNRLAEIGLDIEDVVQPTTESMDIANLCARHGDHMNFCGTMCVQSILPFNTPAGIEHEVQRRLDLFAKGGLFLGPTHAIQVGTPLENILAMYRTAGSLRPEVDDFVLSAEGEPGPGKASLSRLY